MERSTRFETDNADESEDASEAAAAAAATAAAADEDVDEGSAGVAVPVEESDFIDAWVELVEPSVVFKRA